MSLENLLAVDDEDTLARLAQTLTSEVEDGGVVAAEVTGETGRTDAVRSVDGECEALHVVTLRYFKICLVGTEGDAGCAIVIKLIEANIAVHPT